MTAAAQRSLGSFLIFLFFSGFLTRLLLRLLIINFIQSPAEWHSKLANKDCITLIETFVLALGPHYASRQIWIRLWDKLNSFSLYIALGRGLFNIQQSSTQSAIIIEIISQPQIAVGLWAKSNFSEIDKTQPTPIMSLFVLLFSLAFVCKADRNYLKLTSALNSSIM